VFSVAAAGRQSVGRQRDVAGIAKYARRAVAERTFRNRRCKGKQRPTTSIPSGRATQPALSGWSKHVFCGRPPITIHHVPETSAIRRGPSRRLHCNIL